MNLTDVVKKLAPQIRFHSEEDFFPCQPDWFFSRSDIYEGKCDRTWAGGDGPLTPCSDTMTLQKAGPLVAADLVSITAGTPGGAANKAISLWPMDAAPGQNPAYTHQNPDSWYFSDYQLETCSGQQALTSQGQVPCYAHATNDASDGCILISYYFFCSYNGPMGPATNWHTAPLAQGGLLQHYGDWMRIGARVVLETDGTVSLLGVEFDQHGNMQYVTDSPFSFSHLPLSQVAQLVVYSAWHSHEMYPEVGKFPIAHGFANDYTDDDGLHWDSSSNLIYCNDAEPDWVTYNGLWGNNVHLATLAGIDVLTTASEGPSFKVDWSRGSDYVSSGVRIQRVLGDPSGQSWQAQDQVDSDLPLNIQSIAAAPLPNGGEALLTSLLGNDGPSATMVISGQGNQATGNYGAPVTLPTTGYGDIAAQAGSEFIVFPAEYSGCVLVASQPGGGYAQPVPFAAGIGAVYRVAAAVCQDGLHVIMANGSSPLFYHCTMNQAGQWSDPVDVATLLPQPLPQGAGPIQVMSMTASSPQSLDILFLSAATDPMRLMHMSWNGMWTIPEDVTDKLGLDGGGYILDVEALPPATPGFGGVQAILPVTWRDDKGGSTREIIAATSRGPNGSWSGPVEIPIQPPQTAFLMWAAARLTDGSISVLSANGSKP